MPSRYVIDWNSVIIILAALSDLQRTMSKITSDVGPKPALAKADLRACPEPSEGVGRANSDRGSESGQRFRAEGLVKG